MSRPVKESRCYVSFFNQFNTKMKGKTMWKIFNFREWMTKAVVSNNKYWFFACRWFMGWGIGANIVALFLFIHAVL